MAAARDREPIATLATRLHAERSCGNVTWEKRDGVI